MEHRPNHFLNIYSKSRQYKDGTNVTSKDQASVIYSEDNILFIFKIFKMKDIVRYKVWVTAIKCILFAYL